METHLHENCMCHLDNKEQKPMFLVVSLSEVCLWFFFSGPISFVCTLSLARQKNREPRKKIFLL